MSRRLSDPAFASYKLSPRPIPVLVYQSPTPKPSMSSSSSKPNFRTPPSALREAKLSFPRPYILLITLNRPKQHNCISDLGHFELDALYTWFDAEPLLTVAILTGAGKAFCSGADLRDFDAANISSNFSRPLPPSGFGGLSLRNGKKPVICAVNGLCMGGGFEMVINADIVVADERATFALREVRLGIVSMSSALLQRTVGKQRAMEIALTGRTVGAEEARDWGLVNRVVGNGRCVEEALRLAEMIDGNSPDSVVIMRTGINRAWKGGVGFEEGVERVRREMYPTLLASPNLKEGVRSFLEKRKPVWVPSKL